MKAQKPNLDRDWSNGEPRVMVEVEKLFNRTFTLKEFEETFAEIKAEIPSEFLDSTTVVLFHEKEWFQYEPDPYIHGGMKVTYLRPETEEEKNQREQASLKTERERRAGELLELARLQAKYLNNET